MTGQGKIDWHGARAPVDDNLDHLPWMWADVLLDAADRRIILDAKFHEKNLDGPFGSQKLKSANLYQLLAYLATGRQRHLTGLATKGCFCIPSWTTRWQLRCTSKGSGSGPAGSTSGRIGG